METYGAFSRCLDKQAFVGGPVAHHTSSHDSGSIGRMDGLCSGSSNYNIDERCVLDITGEVVPLRSKLQLLKLMNPKPNALEHPMPKRYAPKPPTPKRYVLKPLTPKQYALKPPTPKQYAQKPPTPKQYAQKPPTPKQYVPKPLTPKQHAQKHLAPEQDASKPPAPEQDVLKHLALKQDAPKLPALEQNAPKPPAPEEDALKHLAPKQYALKPPTPKQDALKHLAPKRDVLKRLTPRHLREEEWWIEDGQNKELLRLLANKNQATWDQVVVQVLNMIRCREFTEYNPKTDLVVPTRFCQYNIAFFDLDKESTVVPRPPISKIPASSFLCLEHSANVISVKIAESDVGYPIFIYGTILARDQYDYRCIYLFKRGMDNPQLIMSPDDMLILTGPFRALAVTDSMFFEFNLKIKRVGLVDQDLSKCLLEHNTSRHTCQPMSVSLKSCLSTVVMVYSPVSFGVEASLEFKVLNGASSFIGKVTACTTEDKNRMILYDSEVRGTQIKLGAGGSVALTRRIVAVPLDEGLVLDVSYQAKCFEVTLWYEHDVEQCALRLGPYELQVKVTWTAVERRRRPKMLEQMGDVDLLW